MRLSLVVLVTGVAATATADPKVPQEVTDLAKSLTGTWKCTGTATLAPEPEAPLTGTLKTRADLDGFWIRDVFDAKVGKTTRFKYEAFTTFDGKKWRRVLLDNRGSQALGTCDGVKDGGRMDWNLDVMGQGPVAMFRDHLDATDPKLLKLSGELSSDKGKSWTKVYEMTCKK
ncbi:MAG: DUF1579 family protein [Myxococcales bacterium]|nr:DUF1579 family protein [Myxococcales bacterium]